MVLFPEGRTTDGLAVRKFQPRLFQAALDVRSPVQPVALTYLDAAGQFTAIPSYSGEQSLLESVWRTLQMRGLRAAVHVFDPIAEVGSRDAAAKQSENLVKCFRNSLKCP